MHFIKEVFFSSWTVFPFVFISLLVYRWNQVYTSAVDQLHLSISQTGGWDKKPPCRLLALMLVRLLLGPFLFLPVTFDGLASFHQQERPSWWESSCPLVWNITRISWHNPDADDVTASPTSSDWKPDCIEMTKCHFANSRGKEDGLQINLSCRYWNKGGGFIPEEFL